MNRSNPLQTTGLSVWSKVNQDQKAVIWSSVTVKTHEIELSLQQREAAPTWDLRRRLEKRVISV